MPVYRDENGNIIDEPTMKAGGQSNPDPGYDQATRRVGGAPAQPAGNVGNDNYDAKTRVVGGDATAIPASNYDQKTQVAGSPSPSASSSDAKTQIYRPGKKQATHQAEQATQAAPAAATAPVQESAAMDDPPVGWLVIIQGPGKGNALTIGNGACSIGRDADQRVCVDFGDATISGSHAVITYDPRGRKFYLQHGGGKNLTYLNDVPVLSPTELQANAHIMVGDTLMRFVPFCGAEFDWADLEEG